MDGAGVGRLNDGLGWLNEGLGRLNEGLGRLKDGLGRLDDGLGLLENDLCWKLDMRSDTEPPDLSRPSSWLLAIGEIRVAATTATTAARDLIIFLVNILLLLGPPNVTAAFAAHLPAAYTWVPKRMIPRLGGPPQPTPQINLAPLITLRFSRL